MLKFSLICSLYLTILAQTVQVSSRHAQLFTQVEVNGRINITFVPSNTFNMKFNDICTTYNRNGTRASFTLLKGCSSSSLVIYLVRSLYRVSAANGPIIRSGVLLSIYPFKSYSILVLGLRVWELEMYLSLYRVEVTFIYQKEVLWIFGDQQPIRQSWDYFLTLWLEILQISRTTIPALWKMGGDWRDQKNINTFQNIKDLKYLILYSIFLLYVQKWATSNMYLRMKNKSSFFLTPIKLTWSQKYFLLKCIQSVYSGKHITINP